MRFYLPICCLLFQLVQAVGVEPKIGFINEGEHPIEIKIDERQSIKIARRIEIVDTDNIAISHEIYIGEIWNRIIFQRREEFVQFSKSLKKGLKWADIAAEKDVKFKKKLGVFTTNGLGKDRNVSITFVTHGADDVRFVFDFEEEVALDLEQFQTFSRIVENAATIIEQMDAKIKAKRSKKKEIESLFED